MDFASLRRRNKNVLVEHAFNLFVEPNNNIQSNKEYWVEKLLKGHDVLDFIEEIKARPQVFEDEEATINNIASMGSVKSKLENPVLDVGSSQKIKVELYNNSNKDFSTSAANPLYLAYHWYEENGSVYEFEGIRTPINQTVRKGDLVVIEIEVRAPKETGNYIFLPTLVVEGKAWLENEGLETFSQKIEVMAPVGPPLTRRALNIYNSLKDNAAA
ncbi:hypothetical protein [Vreelandella neptunia]|uniref:Uncharacterized protein n=1 Tax=Vreelandella neptunia TaxID=115551 RepID=A0ABS9S1M8_9GAMM|nr:hypothetical protein [Halomonas neptunia]MCH4810008.1 hypothetical protein [Halomonas neptunia]